MWQNYDHFFFVAQIFLKVANDNGVDAVTSGKIK